MPCFSWSRPQHAGGVFGVAIAIALSVSLSACEGCNDPPAAYTLPDADFVDHPNGDCENATCGDGEVCADARCTLACDSDEACLEGDRCTADGYCAEERPAGIGDLCLDDEDCESRLCEGGSCVPERGCINDGACFVDEICGLGAACVPACDGDLSCPVGEVCVHGGCLLAQPCASDVDCSEGACVAGACERACDSALPDGTGTDKCGRDALCDDHNLCVARCRLHEDCAEGYCVHGVCSGELPDDGTPPDPTADAGDDVGSDADTGDREPDCHTNDDCHDDAARCEDGACVLFDICQNDGECYEGDYCHRGQCRSVCATSEDCRGQQLCVEGRCRDDEGDSACRSTEQCEPCESCIFGVCTVSEFFCRIDEDCGFDKTCQSGFCTYDCETVEDCSVGQSCVDAVCLDDPPRNTECVFNDQCEGEFLCINGRCHTECETHSECGYRQMCDHGVCQPDRRPGAECLHNEHCTIHDPSAECVDGHCALPCFYDRECRTAACDIGFCTR